MSTHTAPVTRTEETTSGGPCRFCGTELRHTFVDLGMSPLCETYLLPDELNQMEPFFPLHVYVCSDCFLVQLQEYVSPEDIFTEYAYFSSYSQAWLDHARDYATQMSERFGLDETSLVVELASNDGYLLRWFVEGGVPVLGVEPAKNVARVAVDAGVPTLDEFFGRDLATRMVADGQAADLVPANNVLAQVPDVNDFVGGIAILLKPEGVATIEFPHLSRLIEGNQFDTIYHEHFSYFSLHTTERIMQAHGLRVFDVEELWSHGGSLRVFACRHDSQSHEPTQRLADLRQREVDEGVTDLATYDAFAEQVRETKRRMLEFFVDARRRGKVVVGYGAPGKGNTLLNYAGIRTDFIDFTVDRNPYKHGRFLPGTHIPIHAPERIDEVQPDYIVIMPWNLRDEIAQQLEHTRRWGAQFVVLVPTVEVF